jgi:fluoride ion exporter CrcB/FEX
MGRKTTDMGYLIVFLGGYTTFSAFSLDTIRLYQRGQLGLALVRQVSSDVRCQQFGYVTPLALASE